MLLVAEIEEWSLDEEEWVSVRWYGDFRAVEFMVVDEEEEIVGCKALIE